MLFERGVQGVVRLTFFVSSLSTSAWSQRQHRRSMIAQHVVACGMDGKRAYMSLLYFVAVA